MQYESITTAEDLQSFCGSLTDEPVIAFDTEFVSDDTYRPRLCLIQVATANHLAIIDPAGIEDTKPFWDLLASPGRVVIAHACREESRFCYRYSGKPIAGLFDTQLAAGFIGMEYPASLATLVQKLVNKTLPKGETRTDWSRRPLSQAQIEYAIHDVTELIEMYHQINSTVCKLKRESWLDEETARLQQKVIDGETKENWRRVSGSSGLKPRQLEIIRHLWRWREKEAKLRDRLPKRVLRDDLMVELARRGITDRRKIKDIRGMERRGLADHYDSIASAIQAGLNTPEHELPRRPRGMRRVVSPMLSQFLSTAIACISRQQKLAPPIVGNADDVRELLGYELDRKENDSIPSLLDGWRGEIVGKEFRKILAGKLAIRVADVRENQPLEFIESEVQR